MIMRWQNGSIINYNHYSELCVNAGVKINKVKWDRMVTTGSKLTEERIQCSYI